MPLHGATALHCRLATESFSIVPERELKERSRRLKAEDVQFPSASEKVVHWEIAIGEPRVACMWRFVKDMLETSVYV